MDMSCLFNFSFMFLFLFYKKPIHFERVPLKVLFKRKYYLKVMTVAMTFFMDFVAFNTLAMIAGTLGKTSLAAHTIVTTFYSNIITFCFAM